jgi:hypothetical protein
LLGDLRLGRGFFSSSTTVGLAAEHRHSKHYKGGDQWCVVFHAGLSSKRRSLHALMAPAPAVLGGVLRTCRMFKFPGPTMRTSSNLLRVDESAKLELRDVSRFDVDQDIAR